MPLCLSNVVTLMYFCEVIKMLFSLWLGSGHGMKTPCYIACDVSVGGDSRDVFVWLVTIDLICDLKLPHGDLLIGAMGRI